MKEVTDKDHQLWHAFNKNPTPENFNTLYDHMKPIINHAISRYKQGSGLPPAAFDIAAADQFLKTCKTFDPTKGVQLKSKLYTDLQSVNRLNYAYQNLARIAEPRATKIGPLQGALDYLTNTLGREPSDAELADEVAIPLKQVTLLRRELRADLMSDPNLEGSFSDFDEVVDQRKAQEVYFELNGTEQAIFDLATGLHGKPRMRTSTGRTDWDGIARKLKLSSNDIRRARTHIRRAWGKS